MAEELSAQEVFKLGCAYFEAGVEAYQQRELERAKQYFAAASQAF